MSVIFILIIASLLIAGIFLGGFLWATGAGQYEDTCTPSMRILNDDEAPVRTSEVADRKPEIENQ